MSRDPWLQLLAQQEQHNQVKRGPQAGYTSIAEGEGSLDVEAEDGTIAASFGNQIDGTFGAVVLNGPEPPVPSPPATDGGPGTVAISWDGGYVAGARRPLDQDFIDVLVAPDPTMEGAVRAGTFVTGGSLTYTTWEPGTYYFALVTETKPGRRSAMSEVVEGTAEVTVTEAALDAARTALEAADQELRDAGAARDQAIAAAAGDLDAAEARLATAEQDLVDAFGAINTTIPADIETAKAAALAAAKEYSDAQLAVEAARTTAAQQDATAALTAAQTAQAAADGAIRTFYQAEPPAGLNNTTDLGDLWYDTDNDQAHRWNGTEWSVIQDSTIAEALGKAETAQATADGKITSYYQDTIPATGLIGDLWFDTNNDNKPHYCTSENPLTWAPVRDGEIANAELRAAEDALTKANTAEQQAIEAAALDATAKADAALAAALDAAQTYFNDTTEIKDINSTGIAPVVVDSPTAMAGKAWQKNGSTNGWWIDDFGKQAFDPTALYRIRARIRIITPATTGGGGFYLGANGYLADGTTHCNQGGDPSRSSQHYVISNAQTPTDGSWVDYEGFVEGNAAANATGSGASDDPKKMHANVRYFSPLVIIDYNGGDGVWELSHLAIDKVSPEARQALSRVEQAETDLRAAEGRLDTNETALTSADQRLDTAETSLNTLNTTTLPGLQGEITTLRDTTIPALDTRLDTAETTISTTLPDAITDAQDAADMALLIAPVSANAPTTADGTGRPVDSVWTRVNASGQEIGRWRWTGSAWTTMPLTATVIPNLAASKITTGTLATARLNATEVAAAVATVIQLNADRITSGTIDTNRLNATEIAAAVATVIQLNADRITAGTIGTARLDTDAIAAATAAIQKVDAGNITVTGTSNLNDVVAERIASKTGQFIELSVDQLTVPGSAAISDLVAEHFAARTSALIEADIGKLTVTAGATINQAVIDKLFTDVVVGKTVTATEAFIGESAILTGAVTARTVTASEAMTAKMVRANMFEGKSFTGGTFTGGRFQTSTAANSGIKIDFATNTLSMWDPTGRLMIEADADTGDLDLRGTQSSTAAAEDGAGTPIELTLASGAGVPVESPVTPGTTYNVPGLVWTQTGSTRMISPPRVYSEAGEGISVDSGINAANQYASLKMAEGVANLSARNGIDLTSQAGGITLGGILLQVNTGHVHMTGSAHVEGNATEAMTFGMDTQSRTVLRNPDIADFTFANASGGYSDIAFNEADVWGGRVQFMRPLEGYDYVFLQSDDKFVFAKVNSTTRQNIEAAQVTASKFRSSGRAYLLADGAALGLEVGGADVNSTLIYDRTYSTSSNVYITSSGTLGRSTSARKYKLAIDPLDNIDDALLSIPVSTWYDKREAESVADYYTAETEGRPLLDEDDRPIYETPPELRRIPGIIAEDVEAAGLDEFVTYGADGQVEGLMYERLAAALIPTVRRLRDRVQAAETKAASMEARIVTLEGKHGVIHKPAVPGTNPGGTTPR